MEWTNDLIEQIRTGWKRLGGDYSASQLAERMGLGYDGRSSVISAAHRYGLVKSNQTSLKRRTALSTDRIEPHLITLPNNQRWNTKTQKIERGGR